MVDGERETRAFLRSPTDSQWLAMLARYGLVCPSFVAPPRLEELRRLTRLHARTRRVASTLRNMLHRMLDKSGLRIGGILTDLFGLSGRNLLDGLVAGQDPEQMVAGARATRARRSRRYWTRWGAGRTRAPSRWSRCCATCRRRSSGRWRTWSGALSRRPSRTTNCLGPCCRRCRDAAPLRQLLLVRPELHAIRARRGMGERRGKHAYRAAVRRPHTGLHTEHN